MIEKKNANKKDEDIKILLNSVQKCAIRDFVWWPDPVLVPVKFARKFIRVSVEQNSNYDLRKISAGELFGLFLSRILRERLHNGLALIQPETSAV